MTRRAPNMKELAVLECLRLCGGATCQQIADAIHRSTPCRFCGGTGENSAGPFNDTDARYGCRGCYGRGLAMFDYGAAYVALMKLHALGLVRRRNLLDQFGDPTPQLVWEAAPSEDAFYADPLEAAFAAPSAEVDT